MILNTLAYYGEKHPVHRSIPLNGVYSSVYFNRLFCLKRVFSSLSLDMLVSIMREILIKPSTQFSLQDVSVKLCS